MYQYAFTEIVDRRLLTGVKKKNDPRRIMTPQL